MDTRSRRSSLPLVLLTIAAVTATTVATAATSDCGAATPNVAVGAQYDSTHVYVAPDQIDAFVNSFTATFGGKPSARITTNVLPVPSSTFAQYVWSPVGTLSTFAFTTPIPYPFGSERTGYLVTDMDQALAAARACGAEVLVDKFTDPIGVDAVIQWPGGVRMQLYRHFVAPSYAPLESIPDNRIYVAAEAADSFVRDFLQFSHGKIRSDEKAADAGEIGRPGEKYRRIRIESGFGKMQIAVTDGHLSFPFGRETTGYQVKDLKATLAAARAAGAQVVSPRFDAADRSSAFVQFPSGYLAEIHNAAANSE